MKLFPSEGRAPDFRMVPVSLLHDLTFGFPAIEESAEWLLLVREIVVSSHFVVALLKVNRVFHLSGGGGVKKRTKGYDFYTR